MSTQDDVRAGHIEIEVACGNRERQRVVRVRLAPGSTVAQAVRASGLEACFAELGLEPRRVSYALWGRRVPPRTIVAGGDRVEILGPLRIDPKEARRRRAAARARR